VDGADRSFLTTVSALVAALDEVPSPAALLDDHGVIGWQNRASLELRGPRAGRHFVSFISPDDAEDAQAAFDAALGGVTAVEAIVQASDVNERYLGMRGRWNAIEMRDGVKVVVVVNLGAVYASSASGDRAAVGRGTTLTRRQLDVLGLLDVGRSTAEIAWELALSPATIRKHVADILAALGVHSRLEALATARARGILAK
jgi:DNA-binding CsgD family transcriptional regulator